jgi:8-oxo-dGTP pyrophosphatase MutT (NUDIX family)
MTMIVFQSDGFTFNYRVGAIALRGSQVLLHYSQEGQHWYVPGGRVEFGESSAEALQREMQEEAGEQIEVGRLLWIAEDFFGDESEQVHELGLYYLVSFPPNSPVMQAEKQFQVQEDGKPSFYQWHDLNDLPDLILYPTFLKAGIPDLPTQTTHLIVRPIAS